MRTLIIVLSLIVVLAGCAVVPATPYHSYGPYYESPYYAPPAYGHYYGPGYYYAPRFYGYDWHHAPRYHDDHGDRG